MGIKILAVIIVILLFVSVCANAFLIGQKLVKTTVVPKNQLILEVDDSCYEQLKNNMDKSVYLKFQLSQ